MNDANGSPCSSCKSTRRIYTFGNRPKSDPGKYAKRGCTNCKRYDSVDCTYDVPLVLKTTEAIRNWWEKIDNRP